MSARDQCRDRRYLGHVQQAHVVVVCEKVASGEFELFLREMSRGIEARRDTDRVVVRYHFEGSFVSDVSMMQRFATAVRPHKEKIAKTAHALALISHSVWVRAGLRTMVTFADLPFPTLCLSHSQVGERFVGFTP
jgi:hypothetical protein